MRVPAGIPSRRRDDGRRAGFTLAEVAVTIVIVGAALLFVLQGVSTAKFDAANTYNRKVAMGLALETLGQLEAGLYWDDIDSYMGPYSYAEEGYENFSWEIALGDAELPDLSQPQATLAHDSWHSDDDEKKDDQDENTVQPYEKVRIRVTYPKLVDYPSELVIERWVPWEQVYGSQGDQQGTQSSTGDASGSSSTDSSGASSSAGSGS